MTRNATRNCPRNVVAILVAVTPLVIAVAVQAQEKGGTRQRSGEAHSALSLPETVTTTSPNLPIFATAVAYDSGGNDQGGAFRSVAVGDVNSDGKLDLVVANYTGNTLGVLLGKGDGTFQTVVTFNPGGLNPRGIAIADLNRDGKLDLAVLVVDGASGGVAVLLGNGDASFQAAVIYGSNSSGGNDLAVADVNRDGIPDLIVAGYLGPNLGVLLGNGDGTFQSAVAYGSGGGIWAPASLAIGDVNGDGNLDLMVANFQGNTVGVVLGKGDGTFNAAVTYNSGGFEADSIAVADVNGDHKPDLVVANCGTNNCPQEGLAAVLLGNGNGTFQAPVTYDSGGQAAFGVAIVDVDLDGKPDLLTVNAFSNTVGVLLGNGDGTFQPALSYDSGGRVPAPIAIADVNGDVLPDVIVGNECNFPSCDMGSLGILLNNSGPHSTTTTTLLSSLNPAAPRKEVTYTATVTNQDGGAVTGSVIFQDGGSPIAMVSLVNNQAAYSTMYKKVGVHLITAAYSGDLHNSSSTSSVLTEEIKGASKTLVTSSVSPSFVGQSVTFTATVTSRFGAIPNGELVAFYDGTTALASVALAGGTAAFTTSALSAKTHTIKATYVGDVTFMPSTGAVQQVVNGYPTTTTLTSSLNPSQFGQAVTFTAHVTSTGPMPTGKVKFLDGATTLGSATLNGGIAKITRSNLTVGNHPITAKYLGDAASDKSTSAVVNQVVQ